MKKTLITAAIALAISATTAMAQPRQEITLTDGWQFSRDKVQWQQVSVPHDWAISGPFDKKWDMQNVAIVQNGEKEKTEKTGRSGALPWIGKGHYKLSMSLPKGYTGAELVIDGAMSEPTVSINGKQAGYWPYGYNAFRIDATPFVKFDGSANLIEISLNNVEESSRWYPGGGIYRPVKLILTKGPAHFDDWGTCVRTLSATAQQATISIDAQLKGSLKEQISGTDVELLDKNGMIVAAAHCHAGNNGAVHTKLDVKKPNLWSPEKPYLYKLRLSHYQNRELIDRQTVNVGIRTVSVSKDGGFKLNGQSRKIKGVCLHHDLGPLGAAVNKAALIRQIKMMKRMGCDAIRTAHNMPSTMQMDICDSLGMMVMAESFDMWAYPKCKNGYARFFKEWGEKDITNLVLNHRNHPSIIMWSIGNEIPEQGMKGGRDMAIRLQDICHKLDHTRPVTQGMDRVDNAMNTGFAQAMDVPGFNYRLHKYSKGLKELPQGFLLGSETASTVSSRGVYKFPVEISNKNTYADGQCSGYDTEYCSWSNLPDDDWMWQEDYSQVIGEFVWTGYDYLGEPTPYDTYWPSRSSYFGICDLAGLPKDRYWLYRSQWAEEPTTHLLPHWTWPGREGKTTPVYCYTDADEGELFVNGNSQGRIKKNKDSRLDRFRLRWNNVVYEPGEIRVVTYNADGSKHGEDSRRTAGKPVQIVLSAECPQSADGKAVLKADGCDMAFITVSTADSNGVPCPTASANMTFTVSGAGTFQAACNGDATSLQPFTNPEMQLFSGQLVAIVRAGQQPGTITFTATDTKTGIKKSMDIEVKKN